MSRTHRMKRAARLEAKKRSGRGVLAALAIVVLVVASRARAQDERLGRGSLCPKCGNDVGGYGCGRGWCVQYGPFDTEDGP